MLARHLLDRLPARIVLPLLLAAACAQAGPLARISARNLLLTPGTPFQLSATPGCFKWIAADSALLAVLAVEQTAGCPEGAGRSVRIETRPLPSGKDAASTMVLAVLLTAEGSEAAGANGGADSSADGELGCEVNIGLVAHLAISTTTRTMVAQDDEMQWLEASATDAVGNAFSPAALRSLAFRWGWDGPADLEMIELEYTRQILEASARHAVHPAHSHSPFTPPHR